MIVFYGSRLYGTIERCGPTRIVTRFVHLQFLPLFPVGSLLLVDRAPRDPSDPAAPAAQASPETPAAQGAKPRARRWGNPALAAALPIPLNLRSVAAAYLRTWGLIAAGLLVFATVDRLASRQHGDPWAAVTSGAGALALLSCFVLCALFVAFSFGLGSLSRRDRAMRQVYAEFVGVPADVALRPREWQAQRERLASEVVERARSFASTGYRTAFDPQLEWDQIVLQPTVRDRRLLRAALTLTRMNWADARGAQRKRLAALHGAIWRQIALSIGEREPAAPAQTAPTR